MKHYRAEYIKRNLARFFMGYTQVRFNQGVLLRKEIPNVKVNVTGMELIVQIPTLTAGTYKLVIRSQFAMGKLLKEPRATVFDKILTVAP